MALLGWPEGYGQCRPSTLSSEITRSRSVLRQMNYFRLYQRRINVCQSDVTFPQTFSKQRDRLGSLLGEHWDRSIS